MGAISVVDNRFVLEGNTFVPVGMNGSMEGIKQAGGMKDYFKRLSGKVNVLRMLLPGVVPQICDDQGRCTADMRKWMKDISFHCSENGIRLLPVLFYPNAFIWKQNPFGRKYNTPFNFLYDGLEDARRFIEDITFYLSEDNLFAWELWNEVSIGRPMEFDFLVGILETCVFNHGSPATVSFAYPYSVQYRYSQDLITMADCIFFHTYNQPDGLLWGRSFEKDLWRRLDKRLNNVAVVCNDLKMWSQNKPWMSTEDPPIPAPGKLLDAINQLTGKPMMLDYTNHFESVCREYMERGASGPGMMWSCCRMNFPDEFLFVLEKFLKIPSYTEKRKLNLFAVGE